MREIEHKVTGKVTGTVYVQSVFGQNNKGDKPCLGRQVRRARNTVKRYPGRTEPKLVERFNRAQALLLAHKLSET